MRARLELGQGPAGLLMVRVGEAADAVPEQTATYEMVLSAPGVVESVNIRVVVLPGTGFAGLALEPLLVVTVNPVREELPGHPV